MRKRRRLANKMTIMVCAVLIAVSAFFYAPMNVSAQANQSFTSLAIGSYKRMYVADSVKFDFTPYLTGGSSLYRVTCNIDTSITFTTDCLINNYFILFSTGEYGQQFNTYSTGWISANDVYNISRRQVLYVRPDSPLLSVLYTGICAFRSGVTSSSAVCSYSVSDIVVEPLSNEESTDYHNGYNAGYADGESAGYGNGYSNGFADGEASVDTDEIYDEAFQAGKDSVDTQSYYDAGYQAGYQVAYSVGYESGYDVGYQSAMDRIESWGADTSDYPLKLSSGNTNAHFSVHVGSDIPFNYRDSDHWVSSAEYNSNHTYKYVINFSNIDEGLDSDILYDYWDIFLNIGGIEYNITPFQDMSVSVFIPGDRISTSYSFDWVLYNCANFVADDSNLAYLYVDYDFAIYDMGPSGDTQNHIANQTDQLTNGYDDSKGNTVNSNLSTGLNDYETAENSLFATATTGMRDFTFFDFESVPAMITGMSFIGSIMGSWFKQAGGASGVGIVLSILFSVILVAMVLGLYRWYQSRGGKD